MTSSSRCSRTYSSAGVSPHHQVATDGIASFSPSRRSQIAGRKPSQRPGLEHAAAERVGDDHVAGARGLEQAGDAERRIAAQFERIAVVVVEAAQDRVHALQAAQRLEVDGVAAHGQVLPLDEREAEVAREIGVLEIGLVVRPRRQQDGERRLVALGRRQRRQRVLQVVEEAGAGARRAGRGTSPGRRARRSAGSPARSRRPTAPACDRRAPTSGRPASAPGRPRRRAARCRPAA